MSTKLNFVIYLACYGFPVLLLCILCSELIEATYLSYTVIISEYKTEWPDKTEVN